MNQVPLLSMTGITKRFPGVLALNQVDFQLSPAEICGLIGENGAGKSTLIRILAGIFQADEGEISLDSEPVKILSVQDSLALGVSVIHQELNLASNLDIASNIFLGREPRKGLLVDRKELYARSAELASRVGITAPLSTLVEKLSPGEQQLVEIAKALSADATSQSSDLLRSTSARILVLDEPTSSLTPPEAEKLFEVMRRLKDSGVSMIYISHRLSEVQEICDRVVVLRDGERVGEILPRPSSAQAKERIAPSEMVKLMVGRDISRFFPQHGRFDELTTGEHKESAVAMSVRNLRYAGCKASINFDLYSGEILGVAGLVGAGRTELMRAIFGIEPKSSGDVLIHDKPADIRSPADAIRAGMGLVPEDRKALGVILEMCVSENITLPSIGSYNPPFMDRKREKQVAGEQVAALDIKTPSLTHDVQFLSGGNQQKVALAKWLSLSVGNARRGIPVLSHSAQSSHAKDSAIRGNRIGTAADPYTGLRILILDEPTRGIDVGSKSEIYKLIRKLADSGVAVMMVSSELEEIIGLSDRVMVMHEGKCTGTLAQDEISEERIMQLATGATPFASGELRSTRGTRH